jgi:hypothetical protein
VQLVPYTLRFDRALGHGTGRHGLHAPTGGGPAAGELRGLTIIPPPDKANLFFPGPFTFDPVQAASGEFDRVEMWQGECQASLFPIADSGQGEILLYADDGRILSGWMRNLDLLGQGMEEALELLVFARSYPVPLSGPPRWWPCPEPGK